MLALPRPRSLAAMRGAASEGCEYCKRLPLGKLTSVEITFVKANDGLALSAQNSWDELMRTGDRMDLPEEGGCLSGKLTSSEDRVNL
ncbi:MAG: hypothetical protein ABR924_09320 [Terracidiphilus sp.]|jgi:hypothetical protein